MKKNYVVNADTSLKEMIAILEAIGWAVEVHKGDQFKYAWIEAFTPLDDYTFDLDRPMTPEEDRELLKLLTGEL